jgi:hypothetical protein
LFNPAPVTIRDLTGVTHTVEATAATLYEAVAQGLAAIRGDDWVAGGGASPRENQRPEQDSRKPGAVDATVEPAGR